MKFTPVVLLLLATALLPASCSKEDSGPRVLTLLSIAVNGANLPDGADNIPTTTSLVVVFSAAVNPADFEKQFSIAPAPGNITFSYANQASKVTVDLELDFQTTYRIAVGQGPIGQNGERLDGPLVRSFTTLPQGIIYALPPCTSATNDCLQTVTITGSGSGQFSFYSSFPVYEEAAEWRDITAALLVVHGVGRDADNYFSYLMRTLQDENLAGKVALISPFFKNSQEAGPGDYYWRDEGWRDGKDAAAPSPISSFAVVDRLIEQLGDRKHFPALRKIIITGHSSGALFTHLYAAANRVADAYPDLTFAYIPANSQYYYYPDGRRIDENSNQLYTPTTCAGYDIWPMGFNIVPPYLAATGKADFDRRFLERSITYLLGNGSGADSALNTTDCNATLLGSSRFSRGENMFRYLELAFPNGHNHKKVIVNGVGHDGSGMYQSPEFRTLLLQLLN